MAESPFEMRIEYSQTAQKDKAISFCYLVEVCKSQKIMNQLTAYISQ